MQCQHCTTPVPKGTLCYVYGVLYILYEHHKKCILTRLELDKVFRNKLINEAIQRRNK